MDVTLLFFLPLIGGFLFVESSYFTRFKAARQETQRLYYKAAACGVVLSVIGFGLHRALGEWSVYRSFVDYLSATFLGPLFERPVALGTAVPVDPAAVARGSAVRVDLAFACAWGFVLGALTHVLNLVVLIVDRAWFHLVARRLHKQSLIATINHAAITDPIELLLTDALRDSTQVQVTLSNQKVYAGWVTTSVDPRGQQQFVRLQPSLSGYRSKDTGDLQFTTSYVATLEKYKNDERKLRSYQLVIPIDKIVSASGFDAADYADFEAARKPPAAPPPAPPTLTETTLSGDVRVHLSRAPR